MKKQTVFTIIIIIAVLVLAYFIINRPLAKTDVEVAKCIGENSVLYVQLGCSHCEDQKKLFGDNYQFLTTVDCFYQRDKCADITGTPTWVIHGQDYLGVQPVEELRKLTGC